MFTGVSSGQGDVSSVEMGHNRLVTQGGWQWNFRKQGASNHHVATAGQDQSATRRNEVNPNMKAIEVIATSIYITNFPPEWNAKTIWNKCLEFGIVVDVYISPRLSKLRKKFAFVRFIRIGDVNRMVVGMSTKWYGSYHLYACVARFSRKGPASTMNGVQEKSRIHGEAVKDTNIHATGTTHPKGRPVSNNTSYADMMKKGLHRSKVTAKTSPPSLVQEEVLITQRELLPISDSATIVLGKVKDLGFIENVSVVLKKEGFRRVEVTYIGGSWIWIEFDNRKACTRFKQRDDLKSYFTVIQNVSRQFVVDDKVIWVEISGMPLGAWSCEAFTKVAAKSGEVVFFDKNATGGIGKGRVCVRMDRKTKITDNVMVELEGIKHLVEVKEIGTWMPNGVQLSDQELSDDHNESEEEEEEEEEQEEFGDSFHDEEDMLEMEDGEILGDEPALSQGNVPDKIVDGAVEDVPIKEAGGMQNRKARWGDEEVSEEVVRSKEEDPVATTQKQHSQTVDREESTETPSRPPGFSKPADASPSGVDGGVNSGSSVHQPAPIHAMTLGSLDSKEKEMVNILNGMGNSNKVISVVEDMEKFINIGECLGYNMEGCKESRSQLIARMGETVVNL